MDQPDFLSVLIHIIAYRYVLNVKVVSTDIPDFLDVVRAVHQFMKYGPVASKIWYSSFLFTIKMNIETINFAITVEWVM